MYINIHINIYRWSILMKIVQLQGREAMRGQIEKLFDRYLGLWDETWHMGEKNSKIGKANINNFLRSDTEEF